MGSGVCSMPPNHILPCGSSCTISTVNGGHLVTAVTRHLDLHCIMRRCADFVTWQHTPLLSIQSKSMPDAVVITVHWQWRCETGTSRRLSYYFSMVEQSMLLAIFTELHYFVPRQMDLSMSRGGYLTTV